MSTLFDLLTAELFSIIHQGWCRAAMSLIGCMVPRVWEKAWKKDLLTQTEDHIFSPWNFVSQQTNLSVLSWLLCSICPRNCCALLRVCPTPAIPKIRYFFLTYALLAEDRDWLRGGNPPLEAGDLLSPVVLLPSSPAVMPAFLGPCVTMGGSHCWERTWASKVFLLQETYEWYMGEGSLSSCPAATLASSSGSWSTEQLHLQPSMPPGFPLNKQGSEVPAAWLNAGHSFGRCL